MSFTFTLTGRNSSLSANFYPPIDLGEDKHSIALIGFNTYNSIPNIDDKINKFYYIENNARKFIQIPTGAYDIMDIELYLQKQIGEGKLLLKPNNNTLKCEIKCIYEMDFTPDDSIGNILGFSKKKISANKTHESDLPVNIIRVSSIRIECNIISGSYYNSKSSHTLYEFSPSVDPGYSINLYPRNLVHLPVNCKKIDNISINLLDQESNLVNFRGEEIVVRLELKKIT